MTGHHIYARSWFELGSKSQNPGTFTVEMTNGVFGVQTDEVVYNKLNPMCASVPESLAPLNTGESTLRLFHPLPDTTVVTRNWFVADKITGRGPVPYAFSLVFRGGVNETFLKNPGSAFQPGAMEPYESFCERVTPDAPVVLSKKYDPVKEDYMTPFAFSKDEWAGVFGFDKELFTIYFSSLCKAICGKQNAKIGLILPGGKDSELLMLATLSLLPMFMKRKFGAMSNWKGHMDGNASKAITGIQLVCCFDARPTSDTRIPVVDLTGAGAHENLELIEKMHAGWVWDNIDNADALSDFEGFLIENFESVLEKMPYSVIENCFWLWSVFIDNKGIPDFDLSRIIIKLLADSFAKNFSKFPFICECIDKCLAIIKSEIKKNASADMPIAVIQAICLLASNGEETARALVTDIHNHFSNAKDWNKTAVTTSYFAGMSERQELDPESETRLIKILTDGMTKPDPVSSKAAQNAIIKRCLQLRQAILNPYSPNAEEAPQKYKDAVEKLYKATNGKLGSSFFQYPETDRTVDSEIAKRFVWLAKMDVSLLGHIPTQEQWIETRKWVEPLTKSDPDKVKGLYLSYYSSIPTGKENDLICFLEVENTKLLQEIMSYDEGIRNDAEQFYIASFEKELEDLTKEVFTPSTDEIWNFVGEWIDRLKALGFSEDDEIFNSMRKAVNVDRNTLLLISASLSSDSFDIIARLFGDTDPQFSKILRVFRAIDAAAAERAITMDMQVDPVMLDSSELNNYSNRMNYWFGKGLDTPTEWALLMTAAVTGSSEFNYDIFIKLCNTANRGTGNNDSNDDAAHAFTAMKLLDGYRKDYREPIWGILKYHIEKRMNRHDFADVFGNNKASSAFSRLDQGDWETSTGRIIGRRLIEQKVGIDYEVLDDYYPSRYKASDQSASLNPAPYLITVIFSALVLVAGAVLLVGLGGAPAWAIIGNIVPFWAICSVGALVLMSTVVSILKLIHEK